MKRNDKLLKEAEAFVRKALSHTAKRPVPERTVRAVAKKVSKVIPARHEKKEGAHRGLD